MRLLLPGSLILALFVLSLWVGGDDCRAPTHGSGVAVREATDRIALEAGANPHERRVALLAAASKPRSRTSQPPVSRPSRRSIVRITGRCVDEHGRALSDCRIVFSGSGSAGGETSWLSHQRKEPRADGLFEIEFRPFRRYQPMTLGITSPGRVPYRHDFKGPSARSWKDTDVGSITLPLGCRISGRLTSTRGMPEGNVEVHLLHFEEPDGPFLKPGRQFVVHTDKKGVFRTKDIVPLGDWELRLPSRATLRRVSFRVPAGHKNHTVHARLVPKAAKDEVRGVVRNRLGNPVAGQRIFGAPEGTRTDGFGCFVIRREPGCTSSHISITLNSNENKSLSYRTERWGRSNLVLEPDAARFIFADEPDPAPTERSSRTKRP